VLKPATEIGIPDRVVDHRYLQFHARADVVIPRGSSGMLHHFDVLSTVISNLFAKPNKIGQKVQNVACAPVTCSLGVVLVRSNKLSDAT
jgi:hypothetical protein